MTAPNSLHPGKRKHSESAAKRANRRWDLRSRGLATARVAFAEVTQRATRIAESNPAPVPTVGTRTPPRTVLQHSARRNHNVHALRVTARVVGLLLLDVCALLLAFGVMTWLDKAVDATSLHGWLRLDRWASEDGPQTLAALCAGLFLVGAYGGGDARRDPNSLASGIGLGLLIAMWGTLWTGFEQVIGLLVVSFVAFTSALAVWRWLIDRLLVTLRKEHGDDVATLLIGKPAETDAARAAAPNEGQYCLRPAACLDPSVLIGSGAEGSFGLSELPGVIASHKIDTIMLCGQLNDRTLAQVISNAEAAGCHVISQSRAFSLASLTPSVVWRGGTPMIELTRPGLHGRDLIIKRVLDLVLSVLAVLVALPVMVVVALLVKLSSRGPIVFSQRRVGYSGNTFTIYKFRTMYTDAEERLAALKQNSVYTDGKLFKMASDPRITPLGRLLRRSSLDELPQLFNVVRGEMSLVGPRPPLPREVELYEDEEFVRFGMKPGITGPWQVSGRNRVTSFAEVVRIESAYITGWTIWRDFRVLIRTIPAVLKMDGAQ